MEKDFKIYKEISAAAAKVFSEGIDAPAGIYKLSELAKVGTTSKTAPKAVFFCSDYNAATVTPAEDAAKEDNNAAFASWRSVWFKLFQVAAAFFCFILCNIFIKGDVVAVSLLDNVSFAPFADRAAARASPGVTPGVSGGNKQTPERTDNAAAPDAMPP